MKPNRMRTVVGSSAQVVAICQELGFDLSGSFRYTLPLPVLARLMTQGASYKAVRAIFGTSRRNRNAWLGNECIYHFGLQK
jgi:hypothetical protein